MLKLKRDELLSNFAFKFNLRHYTGVVEGSVRAVLSVVGDLMGRGLHSSPVQLNLSRFGNTSPCPPV